MSPSNSPSQTDTIRCSNCSAINYVAAFHAPLGPMNAENKSASCFSCRSILDTERCFAYVSKASEAEAQDELVKLKKLTSARASGHPRR